MCCVELALKIEILERDVLEIDSKNRRITVDGRRMSMPISDSGLSSIGSMIVMHRS